MTMTMTISKKMTFQMNDMQYDVTELLHHFFAALIGYKLADAFFKWRNK